MLCIYVWIISPFIQKTPSPPKGAPGGPWPQPRVARCRNHPWHQPRAVQGPPKGPPTSKNRRTKTLSIEAWKVVKNGFGFHKPWLGGNTVRVWKLRNLGLYTLSSPKNDCLSSPMDLYTWIGGDLFHSKLGPLQLAGQPAVFTNDAESAPV